LTVSAAFDQLNVGESIAVMGACLSVVECHPDRFCAFVSAETLARSNLEAMRAGARVNLERALRVGDPLDGHLVTGHVDAAVKVKDKVKIGEAHRFVFALPDETSKKGQIAEKGSVAIDGVSLTVNTVHEDSFEVMVIPLTSSNTTLGTTGPGDTVNLETDILAKYVSRQLHLKQGKTGGVDMDLLARSGFIR